MTPYPTECVAVFKPATRTFLVRAWLQDESLNEISVALDVGRCRCSVKDEAGVELFYVIGTADPAGTQFVDFEISAVQLAVGHAYIMEITMADLADSIAAWGQFPLETVN